MFCKKCGNDIPEGNSFCANCGTPVNDVPQATAPVVAIPEYDHTLEFDPVDISEHKVYAMLSCLCGIVGALVTLLGVNDSKYAMFYAKENIKCTIVQILVAFIAAVLCWTVIVPFAAGVVSVIIWVVRIIGFFNVCSNKAIELPIIRSLGFLK